MIAAGPGAAPPSTLLWTPAAWIGGRWRDDVLLEVGADGHWLHVQPNVAPPPAAARLAGPALPGLVDAHSHAFQRAFAGLAERRDGAQDDFWSWRERMYRVAQAVTPTSMRAIAAHLYVELLRGGYTQVCEFHYLQHAAGGREHADPLAMSMALADAAGDAGIGLTLLPAVYERAGFDGAPLQPEQLRFRADADAAWQIRREFERRVAGAAPPARTPLNAGVAIHSLRAAAPESIAHLHALADGVDGPIHIHVAEQRAEVRDCLAHTGRTPIAWLAAEGLLDARWHLVHATHASDAEIAAVGAHGAGVVLCPGTEANLGDGLADVPAWRDAGVDLAIGSDSQVTRCWREELRWLEYGQRLRLERRNVGAQPAHPHAPQADTAASLFESALAAGARAAGQRRWGLQPGARADLLVADAEDTSLTGLPHARWLDAFVFSSPTRSWRDVMVAGRWALRERRHAQGAQITAAFARAMAQVWGRAD